MDKHPNSKTITIHRAPSALSRVQGPAVDDVYANSRQPIGSYFDSKNSQKIGSGMNFDEEKILLPTIIDIPADDKEFRKRVSEFFMELSTPVPHGTGTTLEIGLLGSNEKPVAGDNMPINIMDYIRYRHALRHPFMAENKERSKGNQLKQYYIFDPSAIQANNRKRTGDKDAALQIYFKIKDDGDLVDQMLMLLGINPHNYYGKEALEDKQEALRNEAENNSVKFKDTYGEADLQIRYWLKVMAETGVLKQVGSRFIDPEGREGQEVIGNNNEEAIWFFKDEDKSDVVVSLKARLQEAITKPIAKTPAKRRTIAKAK